MDDSTNWYGQDAATFGDRVSAARNAAAMSQKQLAKRLGVKLTTLQAWENDVSEPRVNRLSMMAGLLNVSMMWLINGEGEGLNRPEDALSLPADLNGLLIEIRNMRTHMKANAEHLGVIEKRLHRALQDLSAGE